MLLVFVGATAAGCLGSLTGLGGGVVIVPMLVLMFGVDVRLAVGASLVAVIATSCGAAGSFLKQGLVNVRVATLLEVATSLGAVVGALASPHLDTRAIVLLFCAVLFYSAWSATREPPPTPPDESPDALAERLGLSVEGPGGYRVHRVPGATGIMLGAGVLSALVGVGSGVVKVVAMDRLMRMPFKASTATSNFMIGVTAAASAGVYMQRGQLRPDLCAPVAVGAALGALLGTRVLLRLKTPTLRLVFAATVAVMGVQLLVRALSGKV